MLNMIVAIAGLFIAGTWIYAVSINPAMVVFGAIVVPLSIYLIWAGLSPGKI